MIALKGLLIVFITKLKLKDIKILVIAHYIQTKRVRVCGAFLDMNNVSKIYLTTYSTTTFKNFVKDNNTFERDFREYISYLPTYSKNTSKTPNTRSIIE